MPTACSPMGGLNAHTRKKKLGYREIRQNPNTDTFYAVAVDVRTSKLILSKVVKEF